MTPFKIGDKIRALQQAPPDHFQLLVGNIYTIKNIIGVSVGTIEVLPEHQEQTPFYDYRLFELYKPRLRNLPEWW